MHTYIQVCVCVYCIHMYYTHTHTHAHTCIYIIRKAGLKLTARFMDPGPSGFVDTPSVDDKTSDQHGAHALLIVGYT
jgi:hypothetical protein